MARINDPRILPRGYYVRINHTVQSNDNDQRPGLYVNLDKVAICADQAGAAVIQSGPTAAEAFGAAPTAYAPAAPLPAVPSPAPVASTPAAYTAPPATPSPGSPAPAPYTGFIPAAPVPPTPPVRTHPRPRGL